MGVFGGQVTGSDPKTNCKIQKQLLKTDPVLCDHVQWKPRNWNLPKLFPGYTSAQHIIIYIHTYHIYSKGIKYGNKKLQCFMLSSKM